MCVERDGGFGRLRIENLDILAHTGEGADRA